MHGQHIPAFGFRFTHFRLIQYVNFEVIVAVGQGEKRDEAKAGCEREPKHDSLNFEVTN